MEALLSGIERTLMQTLAKGNANDAEFRKNLKKFFDSPDDLVFGSETANEAFTRFQTAAKKLMAENLNDEIVVTHGTVGALFLSKGTEDAFVTWNDLKTPDYRSVSWQ